MSNFVAIIGAGLTGLMAALYLAQRNFNVIIFEKRSHSEITAQKYKLLGQPGRSMSMDISARGIRALQDTHVFDHILSNSVPMAYKITHDLLGRQSALPYGQFAHEQILTVSRTYLFQTLLTKCRTFPNVTIKFDHSLRNIDFDRRSLCVGNGKTNQEEIFWPEIIIGADGINSKVRALVSDQRSAAFSFSRFPMSYKELTIPAKSAKDFPINAMHLWPRNGAMLVAQPNRDLSFTCALLMFETAKLLSFDTIDSAIKIRGLFNELFLDASERMPQLESEYATNPVAQLKIVTGSSWTHADLTLLIGDAAHGMVPFFGQGVNCCFEDCTFLAECSDRFAGNWSKILASFDSVRVREANAINAMSYDNYPELLSYNNMERITLIREVEAMLSARYKPFYRTYHNLVCFDRVPYTLAQQIKAIQSKLLNRLCQDIVAIEQLDSLALERELRDYKKDLALAMGSVHESN